MRRSFQYSRVALFVGPVFFENGCLALPGSSRFELPFNQSVFDQRVYHHHTVRCSRTVLGDCTSVRLL